MNCLGRFQGEKVRTTKITTSKTKKNSENSVDDQNVEMVFLVDQNVEIRTSKMSFELIRTTTIRTSKIALKIKNQTFDVLILPMDLKPIRTSKIYISTTYGVLPMVTKACGGLGQGQLGQVRLGQAGLGQVRFHYVKLGQIRLG